MQKYSMEQYEALFDTSGQVDNDGVRNYRTKTIKSGDMLEVEAFPIAAQSSRTRKAKTYMTSAAQQKVNARNTRKTIMRYLHTNFTQKDIWITLTYAGQAPDTERAHKDFSNYIKRLKRYRRRAGLTEPLRYLYVLESVSESGESARVHFHVVMPGDMNRDDVEALWPHGRSQARRLQPDDYGLEGLARYIAKGVNAKSSPQQASVKRKIEKRWGKSANLKAPRTSIADKKLSRHRVEAIALDLEGTGREVFTKLYPGYAFIDVEVRTSDFLPGAYVYARLRRQEPLKGAKRK